MRLPVESEPHLRPRSQTSQYGMGILPRWFLNGSVYWGLWGEARARQAGDGKRIGLLLYNYHTLIPSENKLASFNHNPAIKVGSREGGFRIFYNIPASITGSLLGGIGDFKGHSSFSKVGFVDDKGHSGFVPANFFCSPGMAAVLLPWLFIIE